MNPFITIKELIQARDAGEISPQEIVAFFKARLEKYNPSLNAALEIFADEATDAPQSGILEGIPGLIKDNIWQKGRITSCGSRILANFHAPQDATVTSHLKNAGAPILGRANMDEFAMGGSGEFSAYGPTRNPWNTAFSPGGSSSGSAAAVAAGLVPWALGSETGGSVRQPSAFCGLVGLYPTYGRFSRYGLIAFASSTDQVGPITRTVYDNAVIASIMSGHDPADATSISNPPQQYTQVLSGALPENLKIGVIEESMSDIINPEIRHCFEHAITKLESLGATIKKVRLPDLKYSIAVYFVISRAEAASNLSRFDGSLYGMRANDYHDLRDMYAQTRELGFGPEVKRRILMGNFVLSSSQREAFYTKAMEVRCIIRNEFENAFKDVDVLMSPTTSTLPFEIGKEVSDPLAMYLSDYFTVPNCIAGIPAISLPCGISQQGLPIGFQFIGPRLSEKLLYQIAYAFEQNNDFQNMYPQEYA